MSLDELRGDPYAWAFVRRHHHERPRILCRERLRRIALSTAAIAVIAVVSLIGATFIGAGPAPAIDISTDGGSAIVSVGPGAGSEQILSELRAYADEAGSSVRVETMRGRDAVVGRVLGDGPGVRMLDSDPSLDHTATRVLLEPGASGTVIVIVAGESLDLGSTEYACSTHGRPLVEVRAELEAAGLRVNVTPVSLDPDGATKPQFVADATAIGTIVNLITQPRSELTSAPAMCR